MGAKNNFPKGLKYEWVCVELGEDNRARMHPLPAGEPVAHINLVRFYDDVPAKDQERLPVTPSEWTYSRADLQHMVETKTDRIGLPLGGSFERAVHNALGQFKALDAQKAAAPEMLQLHLVDGGREQETVAPVLRPAMVA